MTATKKQQQQAKGAKRPGVVPNKDVLSRLNFLHQASALLLTVDRAASRRCVLDMRHICQKAQVRLDWSVKRALCKRCHTHLVDGLTARRTVRNESRDGRASCDVLCVQCTSCLAEKRFPLGRIDVDDGQDAAASDET